MDKQFKRIDKIALLTYVILIGLLLYNFFGLSQKYNKEEMKMITDVERDIRISLEVNNDEQIRMNLDNLRNEYLFDIVVTRDDEVVYNSIPYDKGDNLLERSHPGISSRVSQGVYDNNGDELFIWYSVYRLNDSDFMNSFLSGQLTIMTISISLVGLLIYLLQRQTLGPLRRIKKSIESASGYRFDDVLEGEDGINRKFKKFATRLEDDISVVSREHTLLEKELQAKQELLNNTIVVTRSLIHDLKTPIHKNILENEIKIRGKEDNTDLVDLSEYNRSLNHELMLEVNTILEILKEGRTENDSTEFDLTDLIIRSMKRFETSINERSLLVDFEAPPKLIVKGDQSALILLVHNLLSNMIQYSNEESELGIYIDKVSDEIILEFTNESNEVNIARMKDTEQLFNAIQKPDNSNAYVYSSGNGLYLIKDLTLMLSGKYNMKAADNKVTIKISLPIGKSK